MQLREKFVSALASVLESRGAVQMNLDNCRQAMSTLHGILSRAGGIMAVDYVHHSPLSPSTSTPSGTSPAHSPLPLPPASLRSDTGSDHSNNNSNSSSNNNNNNNNNNNINSNISSTTAAAMVGEAVSRSVPSSPSPDLGRQRDPADLAAVAVAAFDHSRCSDCSYGYSMTCDCAAHLEALQQQAHCANDRLHQLVEIREQLSEEAERLSEGLPEHVVAGGAAAAAAPHGQHSPTAGTMSVSVSAEDDDYVGGDSFDATPEKRLATH